MKLHMKLLTSIFILLVSLYPAPNTTGQGISAPRPGGYAFTLPANQKIVINPGNLQLPGNAEGYSIIYANSSRRRLLLEELLRDISEEYRSIYMDWFKCVIGDKPSGHPKDGAKMTKKEKKLAKKEAKRLKKLQKKEEKKARRANKKTDKDGCSGDTVFNSCGTACPKICGEEAKDVCIMMCVEGCFCKGDQWLTNDHRCVDTVEECDVPESTSDDESNDEGDDDIDFVDFVLEHFPAFVEDLTTEGDFNFPEVLDCTNEAHSQFQEDHLPTDEDAGWTVEEMWEIAGCIVKEDDPESCVPWFFECRENAEDDPCKDGNDRRRLQDGSRRLLGGAGYTFALPGNQAYNILPGNLYLPAQNSGYTVTYQKS